MGRFYYVSIIHFSLMNFDLQDLWVKFDCALCGRPPVPLATGDSTERKASLLASHVGRTFPDASGFPLNSWLQLSTLSRLNTKNITSHSGKASFDSEQQTEMYSTLFVGKKNPLQLLLASMHEVILPVFLSFFYKGNHLTHLWKISE